MQGGISAALAADPVLRNATRFALKLGEHTWGKDVRGGDVQARGQWAPVQLEPTQVHKLRPAASANSRHTRPR